jgi:hypothetical protein
MCELAVPGMQDNQGAMKRAAFLFFVGIALLGYAASLAPYADEALFMERYHALPSGQSAAFAQLRDQMLTPKFQVQDYGATCVAAALGVWLVARRGWRHLKAPASRATLLGLALALPFFTVAAVSFDVLLGLHRGAFPHWAYTVVIPLMQLPFLLLLLLLASGAHMAFLRGHYQSALLLSALSRQANAWLQLVALCTTGVDVLCAARGQYWYAAAGVA